MTNHVIFPPLDVRYPYQRGMLTDEGRWMPLMSDRAVEVFNDYSRVVLLCGARKSGKTLSGLCNKILRHAWEVDGACIGIIGKTVRNVGGGIWSDLLKFSLPGWLDASMGMTLVQAEKMTSDSHMKYIRVSNQYGGYTEIQLHSLNHDQDVEKAFKSMRFSMIVISEVDQFGDRSVIDILLDQLRMTGVPYEQHQLVCDCNPPKEGKDHWLYNTFVNRDEDNPYLMPESSCHHFTLDDNPFLEPQVRENLLKKYQYDPVKKARFVDGRWVKDMTAGHFDLYFTFNIHVVGDASSPNRDNWDVIVPPRGTTTLITGSDIGDVNHATTFMLSRASDSRDVVFDIFDEVVSIDRPVSLRTFSGMIMERILYWEEFMKKEYKTERIYWRHWCDSSLMGYKSGSDSTDAQTIYRATEGKLYMVAARKGPGSVAQRINLTKRLLHGNRLYTSAQCVHTIDWLRNLRKGKTQAETVARGLDCRHAFDSATYAISQEIPIELEMKDRPETREIGELIHL